MTDKQRQAFEADYFGDAESCPARERDGDGYRYAGPQGAWSIWQAAWTASRKLALEEAAQIAEQQAEIYDTKMDQANDAGLTERVERFYHYGDAADYIAGAIRAAAIRQQQEEGNG